MKATQKKSVKVPRVLERINVYVTDAEAIDAFRWLKKAWRTHQCGLHEPAMTPGGFIRDLIVHEYLANAALPKRRKTDIG